MTYFRYGLSYGPSSSIELARQPRSMVNLLEDRISVLGGRFCGFEHAEDLHGTYSFGIVATGPASLGASGAIIANAVGCELTGAESLESAMGLEMISDVPDILEALPPERVRCNKCKRPHDPEQPCPV
jgi:hypothetical protein